MNASLAAAPIYLTTMDMVQHVSYAAAHGALGDIHAALVSQPNAIRSTYTVRVADVLWPQTEYSPAIGTTTISKYRNSAYS